MKKKFLALVLTLAMVLSLVPVTALATNGTPTTDKATESVTTSQDGVNITKKVVTDKEGNHNLVMEAYVEGTTTTTTSTKPLDIVLVLDVSGSMDNSQGWGTTKKIESLKSAVNNFIAEVAKKNTDTDGNTVGHRISIVKFAGEKATKVGNDTYREGRYTYNYSQIVKNLTAVDANGKNALTDTVNSLKPAGATRADYGMELAQSVLPSNEDSNSDKVVVMFTDGTPTSRKYFESSVASGAISASKTLKDKGVKVYTVGIFDGADSREIKGDWNKLGLEGENKNNKYMQAVSSNYPTASLTVTDWSHSWNPGKRAEGKYYLTATDSEGLKNVFQEISDSITHTTVTANANAVLRDTLMDQFVLNGTDENAITVQKAEVNGKDGNEYTWNTPVDVTEITKDISSDGQTVTVKGFNYTSEDNVITEKDGKYSGHKLIVTIPIKVNEAYEGWKAGTKNYDTNVTDTEDKKAGLTGYTKGTDTNASTLLDRSPQVPVTAYKVIYSWGTENVPSNQTIPTDSRNYIPGQSYTVNSSFREDTIVPDANGGSYQFSGWNDPNDPKGVMGTKDVTIIGSWKHTEPTPPDPTYTLTYDANGGKFVSGETTSETKQEMIATTGNRDLKYTDEYTPTNTSEGKDLIFLGWSAEKLSVLDSTSNAAENADKIITSVNVTDEGATVYAVWGLDKDGYTIPDVFEATVTYKIENGYWFDSGTDGPVSTDPVTAQFTLYEKSGNQWVAKNPTLGNTIPTGRGGDEGYTADGWYKDSEKTNISKTTPVTGDVTYTFKYVKVSTEATWDVSRSKIASDLTKNSNGDWITNVTLSLPSAEEKLVSDVVFVMDGSSSDNKNVVEESLKLLEDLQKGIKQSDAAVNVCIVKFKRQAFKSEWYNLSTDFNAIKIAMEKDYSGGTNIHAGLLAGKEALEEHPNVSANRKYLILVSDGSTYLYSKDGNWASDTPFTRSYYPAEPYNGFAGGFNDQGRYNPSNGPTGYDPRNVARPTKTSDVAAWQAYLNDVKARNETVNSEGKTGDDYDYHCEYDNNFNKGIPSADFKSQPCEPRTANNRDMAFYYADQTWQEMKEGGYHLFSIAVKDDSAGAGNADDSHSFMNYLNDGASLKFSNIKNDIFYAVSTGSTVIDTIGEKFTFGGVDSFTLKVGTKEIKGVKDASDANTVNFGEQNSNGKYQYTVTYIPDTKTFAWTINENVSNFAPVQLTYTVKLTKPETAAATYGQTDLDGDTFIDGTQTKVDTGKALYTNQSATLLPVNSAGKPGQLLLFPMPSVSYTIKGSSGGHGGNGGGTVTIPDDVPTGLNGKDHYAYVVGYPDGMVYPQKNITRAEVATIFFRLLTDETREANMTKSNGYNDMKDGAWYTCAVSTLSKMGIIKGYEDGSFKPDASISRAEFAAIAARFDPDGDKTPATFSDVSSHWAKDEISIAANHGWIKGYEDGSFKPDQKITRAETMTLVNRVLKRLPETKDDLHKDMKTWPDNQNESAWFYLAVQEATNSHYQKLKKDGTHETWESMRETRDWAALEK